MDALARGDTIAALNLDREPQIHVGKAHHITHPDRSIYAERRSRNEGILTRNKETAAIRADRMRGQIARADSAAYVEARLNAIKHDTWQPTEKQAWAEARLDRHHEGIRCRAPGSARSRL